jgi:guanine nucleotide-binding protein G(i) subunit alpha
MKDIEEINQMDFFQNSSNSEIIIKVIKDQNFQNMLRNQKKILNIFNGAEYYLNEKKMREVCSKEYVPSHLDILLCRRKSVGITSSEFIHNRVNYLILDVGGVRSERKKWASCK